jgi:hypothetical protein
LLVVCDAGFCVAFHHTTVKPFFAVILGNSTCCSLQEESLLYILQVKLLDPILLAPFLLNVTLQSFSNIAYKVTLEQDILYFSNHTVAFLSVFHHI